MPSIDKAVEFMIEVANDDTHGYDQTNRNGPDYDCSSLVGTALNTAGFNVSPKSWTGNLEKQLRSCGFKDCKKPWKAGDIHLKVNKHVCMSINETHVAHASINEMGKTVGGKTGDQTGKEICIRNYYDYAGGWSCHLRYTEEIKIENIDIIATEVIAGKWGAGETRKKLLTEAGYDYNTVQSKVNEILKNKTTKTNGEIVKEVIAGKWGTGETRKKLLTEAGYNYYEIQTLVNKALS